MATKQLQQALADIEAQLNEPDDPNLIDEIRKQFRIRKQLEKIASEVQKTQPLVAVA